MGGPRLSAPDRLGAPERRRHLRVPVPQPATVDLGLRRGAALLDVSEDGVGVRASCHAVQGIVTSLCFALPGVLAPIRTMATVAWTDASGRMGLAFRGLSEDHLQLLARWGSHPQIADYDEQACRRGSVQSTKSALEGWGINAAGLDPLTVTTLEATLPRVAALAGATGAAVAIERAGAIVCVATWGNAPALNTPVEPESGLSGECIRTRELVWCVDTESDPRIDPLLSRQLDLRSIVIAPLRQGERVIGVIEMYSNVPHAFNSTQVKLLTHAADLLGGPAHLLGGAMLAEPADASELLIPGGMVLSAEEDSAAPIVVPQESLAPPETPSPVEAEPPPRPAAMPVAVAASIAPRSATAQASARAPVRPLRREKKPSRVSPVAPRATAFQRTAGTLKALVRSALVVWFTTALGLGSLIAYRHTMGAASHRTPARQAKPTDSLTSGGLTALGERVDDAKVRIRELVQSLRSGLTDGGTAPEPPIQQTGPHLTGGKLLQYVQPVYPEAALRQELRGPVILRVQIGKTGRVQRVDVLRGPPLLARAAKDAVRLWRYEPFRVDGDPIEMQTVITVPFAVPQP